MHMIISHVHQKKVFFHLNLFCKPFLKKKKKEKKIKKLNQILKLH